MNWYKNGSAIAELISTCAKMFRQLFLVVALAAVTLALPFSDFLIEREGRIVGGSNAALGQFPYQVSLRTAANSHFCGGSIIK